jgi:ankyrin repeat protein
MKLNRVETIGVQYVELERMAGTTILGLLAIKNNVSAFLHMLSFNNNIPDALNAQDLYGNTPLHYFALRGKENCALSAHLREMGACILTNRAHQSPHAVQVSRHIVCCEDGNKFGASYCAIRQVVTIVPCD